MEQNQLLLGASLVAPSVTTDGHVHSTAATATACGHVDHDTVTGGMTAATASGVYDAAVAAPIDDQTPAITEDDHLAACQQQEQEQDQEQAPQVGYNELFPALPDSGETAAATAPHSSHVSTSSTTTPASAANTQNNRWVQKMRIGPSTVTQVFCVPADQRRTGKVQFGESPSPRLCADIMQQTGTSIEGSTGRDQSLTFVVSGRAANVLHAKKLILEQFQQLGSQTVDISKEHHRFILGRGGVRLREIEQATATTIKVPGEADPSETLLVRGAREDIEKAVHQLRAISDQQSKQARVTITVPKIYHAFISGANGENVTRMTTEHPGVRVNIPPSSVQQDDIFVTGEKEGVALVEQEIRQIGEMMEHRCRSIVIEVNKSQHRYVLGVRGSGLAEIQQKTGVVVELPPVDSQSGTVTLRGTEDRLGAALTMVYERANSVLLSRVDCPAWCHRRIIGKKGADIKQLTADLTKVNIEFDSAANQVRVEGPREEVAEAEKRLTALTTQLVNSLIVQKVPVPARFLKHIIGKSGATINRIKSECDVYINIPENEQSPVISVEGAPAGVERACRQLREMAAKLENEKERDIIIEHRFHRQIIGQRGENINQLRQKFDQVTIVMPKQGDNSDIVKLRGPKDMVDQCYRHLQKMVKDLQEASYQERVAIYKQYHKNLVGKGGATIRRIRDETGTQIELPDEASSSCDVLITGRRSDVEAARAKILQLQNELDSVVQQDIVIAARFHQALIGAGGRHIQAIMNECGGVQISFPAADAKSDKVTLRGPKEDVIKAKKVLIELANEKTLQGHTVEVHANPDHHRFLIGKKGSKIDALRNDTNTRIIFPGDGDRQSDIITIVGKKDNVEQAQQQLQKWIKDLDMTVSDEMHVPVQHHRHFVLRRAEVLRQLKTQYGGVEISFPRAGCDSDVVTLKGARQCVDDAKQRILQIVDTLERQVTMQVEIAQRHHGSVMGQRGMHVQRISQEHDVYIKFPERRSSGGGGGLSNGITGESTENMNGDVATTESGGCPADVILVTGLPDNCELARDALLALVPVSVCVSVPADYHRLIIGQRGRGVRELMNRHNVNVSFPSPAAAGGGVSGGGVSGGGEVEGEGSSADTVVITGVNENVEEARAALLERVRELDDEKADRQLRSFSCQLQVAAEYLPKIIGRGGAVVSKIRRQHDVNIDFPARDASAGEDSSGADRQEDQADHSSSEQQQVVTITVSGYQASAEAARDDIQAIVAQQEQMVRETVMLDRRVHARIIGQRGRNIHQIMKDFQVDVRFPRANDHSHPDEVTVSGCDAAQVDECIDHLRCLEEEYVQDVVERQQLDSHVMPSRDGGFSNGDMHGGRREGAGANDGVGFVVAGAPWQKSSGGGGGGGGVAAPNVSSNVEFPSFGGGGGGAENTADSTPVVAVARNNVVWGPRR